jgi:hypothetical protein
MIDPPGRWYRDEHAAGGWHSHSCEFWESVHGCVGKCHLSGKEEHFSCANGGGRLETRCGTYAAYLKGKGELPTTYPQPPDEEGQA